MEILVVDEQLGVHIFILILLSVFVLIFLGATIGGIISMVEDFSWGDLLGTLVCLVISGFLALLVTVGIVVGATVQYKAKVTDFNEVYNNGYKVVDQEGELYILEKEN